MSANFEDDENQEPLALLVVHAAMHMLFLPQFTCDFYEEQEQSDRGEKHVDSKNLLMAEDHEATMRQLEIQAKEDREMKAEAGLLHSTQAESGVMLVCRPTSIVWAAGCGIRNDEVRFSQCFYSFQPKIFCQQLKSLPRCIFVSWYGS